MSRLASSLGALLLLLGGPGCPSFDKEAQANGRPVVSAGEDQVVAGGEAVTLTATATDPDDDPQSYTWRQTTGPGVTLSGTAEQAISFTAPLQNTSLIFEVRVHDGFEESLPDLVQVDVRHNRPPIADPGEAWSTPNGTPVRLRGTASDPDGDEIVSWQWTVVSGPPGASLDGLLEEADTRLPTFTPLVKGDYQIELFAGDGAASSEPAETLVIAENRAPMAAATATVSPLDGRTYTLDASPSSDPDGDPITAWRWRILATPLEGSATLTGATDQAETTVELIGSGGFQVELVVFDDEGAASAPEILRLYANEAPLLSLNRVSATAPTGARFDLDASASVDPDGDPIFVTWTRGSGSARFPDQVVGFTPSILAPSFQALIAAGEDTWATYEVVASDGILDSTPQTVTLYAGPPLSEYVIVSSALEANDIGSCGSIAQPCETVARGLEILTGGGGQGDGRTLLLTTGAFIDSTPEGRSWPVAVDLQGGFDPVTFLRDGTPSELNFESTASPCDTSSWGVYLPNGAPIEMRGVSLSHTTNCTNLAHFFLCNGCQTTLREGAASLNAFPFDSTAFKVTDGGELDLERMELRATAGYHALGISMLSGNVTLRDSRILVAAGASSGRTIELKGGVVRVDGSYFQLSGGGVSTNTSDTIFVDGGLLELRNSVVAHGLSSNTTLEIRRGGVTIENSTLLGYPGGAGVIRSLMPLSLVNSLLDGGATALRLDAPAARQSQIFSNALSADAGVLVACRDAADTTDLELSDPGDLSACNDTATPWSGNLAGPCAFVDEAGGDYHLEIGVANPCLDTGTDGYPGGLTPTDDLDQETRPQGAAHDIGADEAG